MGLFSKRNPDQEPLFCGRPASVPPDAFYAVLRARVGVRPNMPVHEVLWIIWYLEHYAPAHPVAK